MLLLAVLSASSLHTFVICTKVGTLPWCLGHKRHSCLLYHCCLSSPQSPSTCYGTPNQHRFSQNMLVACMRTNTQGQPPQGPTLSFLHNVCHIGQHTLQATQSICVRLPGLKLSLLLAGALAHKISCRGLPFALSWNPRHMLLAYSGRQLPPSRPNQLETGVAYVDVFSHHL